MGSTDTLLQLFTRPKLNLVLVTFGPPLVFIPGMGIKIMWEERKLTGENLKAVWAEFSTLS
jgi:hypothetical protein